MPFCEPVPVTMATFWLKRPEPGWLSKWVLTWLRRAMVRSWACLSCSAEGRDIACRAVREV